MKKSKRKEVLYNILPFIIIPVILILSIWHGLSSSSPSHNQVQYLKEGFRGVVVKIVQGKTTAYMVRLNKTYTKRIDGMSGCFIKNVQIGDTIYKIPNQNKCIIYSKGKKIESSYMFIPQHYHYLDGWDIEKYPPTQEANICNVID